MKISTSEKRRAFRKLHEGDCFLMPNPWDVGSAVALERLGFAAVASTSAGMAWSLGRADNSTPLAEVVAHLAALASAVDIPLNADFENGFADEPKQVGENVALAVDAGVAGLSIEDSTGEPDAPLYDFALAVERVAAARRAIDAADAEVVLTARSEGFIAGRPDLEETLRRLRAYAEAGADCLYAPGLREEAQIAGVVGALAPRPVNVLTLGLPVTRLAALGVRRISVGGSLARAAWGEFFRAAREMADEGGFASFSRATAGRELNQLFASRS
ncbi:MAG TPA: isocitrate lyase/phosphoenolpyruvate mutase family protein [Caulobacteraceae bacterium]